MFISLSKSVWFFVVFLLLTKSDIKAQNDSVPFRLFVQNGQQLNSLHLHFPGAVQDFYTGLQYQPYWLTVAAKNNLTLLLTAIQKASQNGLDPSDYHPGLVTNSDINTMSLKSREDSFAAEVQITDAALHYFHDLVYGNRIPEFSYKGIPEVDHINMLTNEIVLAVKNNIFPVWQQRDRTKLPEMKLIELKIKALQDIIAQKGFSEVLVTKTTADHTNTNLLLKMYYWGLDSILLSGITEKQVKTNLKFMQRMLNLPDDGKLGSATLKALNVPVAVRLLQLKLALNYYRWLNALSDHQPVIVVNLPATILQVVQHQKAVMSMRVIVGKKSSPTPTLTSTLHEVVLYPYWHVPYSIATKELLPSIKRNPDFIAKGNYQVLDKNGKIQDPYSIPWKKLSVQYFPYTIRQSTGCDNALGLLKLNFDNPFSVYLHDTPNKDLFRLHSRFYSHGCMRMEKPMDIGKFVLGKNAIAIDTLSQKGCLLHKEPVHVPVMKRIPVVVWYNPVGMDAMGNLVFYEDIYQKFNWTKN